MNTHDLHITIHMVASLDGKIAKPDNSVAWFETSSSYPQGVESQDPETFLQNIDCYVMGARTYALAESLAAEYGWAYGDKPTIVLTHQPLQSDRPSITFFAGDLQTLLRTHLQGRYRHVWVVGGAHVAREFIQQKLVDEIRVSILPILLGEGLPYFDAIGQEQALYLKEALAYQNGMVELVYSVPK